MHKKYCSSNACYFNGISCDTGTYVPWHTRFQLSDVKWCFLLRQSEMKQRWTLDIGSILSCCCCNFYFIFCIKCICAFDHRRMAAGCHIAQHTNVSTMWQLVVTLQTTICACCLLRLSNSMYRIAHECIFHWRPTWVATGHQAYIYIHIYIPYIEWNLIPKR